MATKNKVKEEKDWQKFYPLCPFCEQEIKKLNAYVLPLTIDISFHEYSPSLKRDRCIVTSCPHCRKTVGVYDFYEQ
jgi:hypothetical protein